jgi:hypothetical protein
MPQCDSDVIDLRFEIFIAIRNVVFLCIMIVTIYQTTLCNPEVCIYIVPSYA